MDDKDVIIRVSSTNQIANEFFDELIEESRKIGLIADKKAIRKVPDKIKASDKKNKKANDVKISVSGDNEKIEDFIALITIEAEKQLSLISSSINIKLEKPEDDK